MVLFDTIFMRCQIELVTLHQKERQMTQGFPASEVGCMVMTVDEGCAVVEINMRIHPLRKGDLIVVWNDDRFTELRHSVLFRTHRLFFPIDVAESVMFKTNIISYWDYTFINPVIPLNETESLKLREWMSLVEWVQTSMVREVAHEIMESQLYSFIATLNQILPMEAVTTVNRDRKWHLAMEFWKLLARHGETVRDVTYYADRLNISTTYLNKIANQTIGTSPKEVIMHHTVDLLKSFLSNTDLTVEEIAVRMEFEDSSYLCRLFRRSTGMSPIQYRNEQK